MQHNPLRFQQGVSFEAALEAFSLLEGFIGGYEPPLLPTLNDVLKWVLEHGVPPCLGIYIFKSSNIDYLDLEIGVRFMPLIPVRVADEPNAPKFLVYGVVRMAEDPRTRVAVQEGLQPSASEEVVVSISPPPFMSEFREGDVMGYNNIPLSHVPIQEALGALMLNMNVSAVVHDAAMVGDPKPNRVDGLGEPEGTAEEPLALDLGDIVVEDVKVWKMEPSNELSPFRDRSPVELVISGDVDHVSELPAEALQSNFEVALGPYIPREDEDIRLYGEAVDEVCTSILVEFEVQIAGDLDVHVEESASIAVLNMFRSSIFLGG